MSKIRRIFSLYKKEIIATILLIVFIIIIIQVLNDMARNSNRDRIDKISQSSDYGKDYGIISGELKEEEIYNKETDILQNFIDYCNTQDYENAYNMLTNECKEILYPNIDMFIENYCKVIFDKQKTCKFQLWNDSTYKVEIRDDAMSTGIYMEEEYIQDYYTLKSGKINISDYIDREKINSQSEKDNIIIKVNYIDYYIDYLQVNISIINNNNDKILLDSQESESTIVLRDNNDLEFTSNISEFNMNDLIIDSNSINDYTLQFELSYRDDLSLKSIDFKNILKENNNTFKGVKSEEIEVEV